MGQCCSVKKGLDDRRRIVDHFLPQGPVLEPRYTYRFCTSVRARFCCARVLVRRLSALNLRLRADIMLTTVRETG